ncbi:MAG: hypothetical protein JW931_06270 [Methanomicrobiaceae archaeon]|nr:hypothetical protein [Methanomicrobiaceae archaeon]
MTEKKGHFEKGKWVEEKEAEAENTAVEMPQKSTGAGKEENKENVDDFDEKIAELKSSVSKNLNDLFGVGKALLTTEKGRNHLAKKMKKAEEKIDKTIEDIAEGFEKAIKK